MTDKDLIKHMSVEEKQAELAKHYEAILGL